MPLPRITGLLNNCALNSALPIILDGISKLAEREAAGALDSLADNSIFQQYKRLKDIFAKHYGVDNVPAFNWGEFHQFLASYSFYANEILFAPIVRSFIAEVGLASGYYARPDLMLLRDVQRRGSYTTLPDTEAIDLFHKQFGITVQTYEYVENRREPNPMDNYNLVNTKVATTRDYPFGVVPQLKLWLKGRHFEIQPHESLVEANRAYVAEINTLPPALAEIHNGLSISQHAHSTNLSLGRLTVYGHQALMQQLARVVPPIYDIDTSLPPAAKNDSLTTTSESSDRPIMTKKIPDSASKIHQAYLISASTYATTGRAYHSNTPAGRQTFAALLLTILLESNDTKAPAISAYLDNLAIAANGNEPLASYHLDKLAIAIIKSKANLNAKLVTEVVQEIESDHQAKVSMSAITTSNQDKNHIHLVSLAEETIQKAWQLYQETKDEYLITVINKTRIIATDPTQRNIRTYNELREKAEGKGSWGKMIAGIMLTLIGAALIVAAIAGAVVAVGASAPVIAAGVGITTMGIASITAGACFFNAGKNKGLYNKMQQVGYEASMQLEDECVVEPLSF